MTTTKTITKDTQETKGIEEQVRDITPDKRYTMYTSQLDELHEIFNRKGPIDALHIAFKYGYMQGQKAEKKKQSK